MILSLALVFLVGMALGKVFELLKLPSLLGMLITGILLGPFALDLLDEKILGISAELRQIALIIILARAGFNLDIDKLRKVGRAAILMCFLPAMVEIIAVVVFAPILLGISHLDALLMATVLAAVSPAVIVPKMLKISEEGYGNDKSITQMVMAGAAVDDIFVIVLFTVVTGLVQTGTIDASNFLQIPSSIILGLLGGVVLGLVLCLFWRKFHMRDSAKILIILSLAFVLVAIEDIATGAIAFSGLLAVMALGATMKIKSPQVSTRLSQKLSKLWVGAEIMLFVLVGASVNISYAYGAGIMSAVLIFIALVWRFAGVFLCMLKTNLTSKERLFVAVSYLPKATVQAAIGGIPLAMGFASGDIVLTVAVVAILITAPVGSFLIERLYKSCLQRDE